LDGLRLDPRLPGDFAAIVALQQAVVERAEALGIIALLDVPPGLEPRRVLDWRSRFRSSYAAGYHPWLKVARPDDGRDALILLPPSAVAAGVIARRELVFGVPHGPFNALAAGGVVAAAEAVSPARHGELHQAGINVFLADRDGILLTGGRTLSGDPSYRQLSVRRLLMLIRRVLERETQWLVFEPNGPALWAEIRRFLTVYLRQLYRAGAFAGATEQEAFFVRCNAELNPQRVLDSGQLIVEVGVAPAEPIEFVVLRLIRSGDGTLTVEG
ncbi:MAG TPA: phage tail sheath C-terminal domain-containing protein, partial [Thermoanaerobaculia bacterium]|nr:phage tail sheath C-terminal domain-containing protein [Thermoanaerobaculia bacterium]